MRPLSRWDMVVDWWWDLMQGWRYWKCEHIHHGHAYETFGYSHINGFDEGCRRCGDPA